MATKSRIKNWMRLQLSNGEFRDSAGEILCGKMAEEAAWAHDVDHWLDEETHWIWDVAVDVAEEFQGK